MLAGGIGITPLMSMLRSLRDAQSERQVLLIYTCRTEADLAFRRELEGMSGGQTPQLKIIWMLDDPPAGWQGEFGRIDGEKLKRFLAALPGDKAYYVCGPPPMMAAALRLLRNFKVPVSKIRCEHFSF